MILREFYPDTDVILTAFFQTVKISAAIKPNLNTENSKLYEDVSLPISDYLFREEYKKHSHRNEKIKKEIFDYDCKRLGLQNDEQKHWYSTLLKKLSDVMPDVRTLFELEMNKLDIRENFDYRNLNISLEYNMYTSWAVKLLMELSTADKTHSPKRETQVSHDLKKTRQRFFCLHLLYHIRNASFASPLAMNISDIFYVRHSDIGYSFNMMSHLGVTQSLSTVRKRQNKIAECRNVMAEVKSFAPCTWTFLWDNFNKTHGSHSVIYGDSNTHSVEVINRAAFALPPPKNCPNKACQSQCENSCHWGKERMPNEINFDEIYLNKHETNVKTKFTEIRSKFFLRETLSVFALLSKLSDEHNTRESILAQTLPSSESTIDVNTFLQAEFHITLENIRNNLSTRNVIRKLYDVKHSQSSSRIILPSVGGKDTDPNLAYEILQYGLHLFLNQKETSERIFVGGDQKTMGIAMRLKKQYDNFNQIYVTVPDLHFRKSLMHAIFKQYEFLGLKHLAKLCGHTTDNQWEYIKNVCSIHKSFEFLERLCDSLRITLSFEFYNFLIATKQITIETIFKLDDDFTSKIVPMLRDFIEEASSSDQVFQKNIDLLNTAENILSHYTAERTRNWDLRTAALKESVHFAMISNCTQYGPLVVELLFHQFSFQQRYLDLMKDGYFTFKLRDVDTSAFVGNEAVIEDVNLLAGQFRHKRQTLEQAIDQSNSIDILQKQQESFNKNLNIEASSFEHVFKDDRETKIRLIRALIHFDSFKNEKRLLHNEFSSEKQLMNPELLKTNWYPAADYLIRRFVRQNVSNPFCNLITAGPSVSALPEVSHKLIKRISKSPSIVISLKPKAYIESAVDKKSIMIKRKAKQIVNQLYWEESNFENAAAICNHDGTKINTNKSKIKDAIKTLFGKILEPENCNNGRKFSIGEKEWLTDFALH